MVDKDGFYVLVLRNSVSGIIPGMSSLIPKAQETVVNPSDSDNSEEKDTKKDKKKKKVKFKKGSVWHKLWKRIKHTPERKSVKDFHESKMTNYLIYTVDKLKVLSGIIFDKATLKSIRKKAEDSSILIDVGDDMYYRVSIESYAKLSKIDKVAIRFKLSVQYDGMEDYDEIMTTDKVFNSINELLNYVSYIRHCVDGVFQVQLLCCWYDTYDFDFKILVYKKDGSIETYKGDMNDFLEEYGLMKL